MIIEIEVTNVDCKIKTPLDSNTLAILRSACSFQMEGSEYKSYAYMRKGIKWDGSKKLFNIQTRKFPIGLLVLVTSVLRGLGHSTAYINNRTYVDNTELPIDNYQLRGYQTRAVNSSLLYGNGIVKAATGCFTGDTIIQVNASKRGKKQTIESLYCSWNGVLRKISKYGTIGNQPIKNKDQVYVRGLQEDRVGPNKVLDVVCKGNMATIRLVFDDGTTLKCTPDHKLYDADNNAWVRADMFMSLNIGKDTIKPVKSDIQHTKHNDSYFIVPSLHPYAIYIVDNRKDRKPYYKIEMHRAIYEAHINGYDDIRKWRNDIGRVEMEFIDPSIYDVHHIDGNHYNNDPLNLQKLTKSEHHKIHCSEYKNNFGQGIVQKTKCISIEDNGVQEVFDIICDKYHSYTANGLIVHNSGKTTIAARTISALDKSAIFVVHTRDLLYQTIESFSRMFPGEEIGQIGDGVFIFRPITVATMQSLAILGGVKYESYKYDEDSETIKESKSFYEREEAKRQFQKYSDTVGTVMYDEVQLICSQTAYSTRFMFQNANSAFGYSASPWRDDGSDMMIEAAFGSRICDITASELIDQGYLVQPHIIIKKTNNRKYSGKKYQEIYQSAIVDNYMRNMQVTNDAYEQYRMGRNTLVLINYIAHGQMLEKMLNEAGAPAIFISGKSNMKKRRQVIQDMRDGKAPIVIASTIADVGLDVPRLQSIVEAGAGKSSVTALQRLGRIMRPFEGKDACYFTTYRDNAPFLCTQVGRKIEIWKTEPDFIIEEQ